MSLAKSLFIFRQDIVKPKYRGWQNKICLIWRWSVPIVLWLGIYCIQIQASDHDIIAIYQVSDLILQVIIHQLLLFVRDWSQHATWLNMPQLQIGNIRVIFPIFKDFNFHFKINGDLQQRPRRRQGRRLLKNELYFTSKIRICLDLFGKLMALKAW